LQEVEVLLEVRGELQLVAVELVESMALLILLVETVLLILALVAVEELTVAVMVALAVLD
jgi:hypothetical protein